MKMMDLWSFKEIWILLLNGKEHLDAGVMLLQFIDSALQDKGIQITTYTRKHLYLSVTAVDHSTTATLGSEKSGLCREVTVMGVI